MPKASIMFSILISFLGCPVLLAHCDTMSGPVILDAKSALAEGDLTPVLKWVKKKDEAELKLAFQQTMKVRNLSPDAKQLADNSFFETLVRLHRAGEGAPFTGINSEPLEPAMAEADHALESGSIELLSKTLTAEMQKQLQDLFSQAMAKKSTADQSVEKGREYVEAYVRYVHYVEALHQSHELRNEEEHH